MQSKPPHAAARASESLSVACATCASIGAAVCLSSFFSKIQPTFTQPLLTAEPMHPPAQSPTTSVGRCRAAVPALSGANIGSGARSGAGFCAGLRLTHRAPQARGLEFFCRKARQTALARSQNATDSRQSVVRFSATLQRQSGGRGRQTTESLQLLFGPVKSQP